MTVLKADAWAGDAKCRRYHGRTIRRRKQKLPIVALHVLYQESFMDNSTSFKLKLNINFVCFSHSEIDAYGFRRPDDFDYETYEQFMSQYLSVLARRAGKWDKVMDGKKNVKKSFKGTCTNLCIQSQIILKGRYTIGNYSKQILF